LPRFDIGLLFLICHVFQVEICLFHRQQGFYSVSLLNGELNVWLNGGSGTTEIRTWQRYNDALMHSVSIRKSGIQ